MDYESYKNKYMVDPAPQPLFNFAGISGAALYVEEFAEAIKYYESVLGKPAYIEGEGTRSWRLGETWLTILKGRSGNPKNVEIVVETDSPQEAERLQAAFIKAGGKGEPPSDQLMHIPVRYCAVDDPFGTTILVIAPLET